MTTTSDERREVAERLRKCGADPTIIGAGCGTCLNVIDHAIGCRADDSWERFFGRLADLIDPTCHVVINQQDAGAGELVAMMLGSVCSSCGHDLHRDRFTGRYPAHCPGCGARVAGGDAR